MRKFISLLLGATLMVVASAYAQTDYRITPQPNATEVGEGSLDISKGLSLYIDAPREELSRLESAASELGIELRRVKRPTKRGYLNLAVVDIAEIKGAEEYRSFEEGYLLNIGTAGVDIKATTAAGLYYGLHTLRQMCHERRTLAACQISDAPRFEYRGILIDISRHFRSVEFLKRQIDAMAELKMNRLHLHLTDAAGWRIEVESYPRLCNYAAWRTPATWKG